MSLNSSELSLDLKPPTYVPKTISQFLGDVSRIGSVSEKILKVDDFLNKLETEMKKIDAFKRELPLSMVLINDAIATLKVESMLYKEQTLHSRPVLAEFIPLKKGCDKDEKDEIRKNEDDTGDKRNWLSSTQLWGTDDNQYSGLNPSNNQKPNSIEETPKRVDGEDHNEIDGPFQAYRNSGRALFPFKGYSPFPAASTITRKEGKEELPVVPLPGLSLITPATKNPVVEIGASSLISKASTSRIISCSSPPNVHSGLRTGPLPPQQQASRKQRRCWSPELHRRFVSALQQLGGSQAATPKQIRELMQVDGLTNDEVKSHLQKYRLHTRRVPSSSGHSPPNLWTGQEQCAESSKQSNNSSHSHSPEGPLQLATGTTGESMDYDDDEKSESCCWKTHLHTSAKVAAA